MCDLIINALMLASAISLLKFLETELKKLIKTGKKKTATVEF
jgi:hypothetical protein